METQDLELYKESLARMAEDMETLCRVLDLEGHNYVLDESEKNLLRFAIINAFNSAMKESTYLILAGNVTDGCKLAWEWVGRVEKLA